MGTHEGQYLNPAPGSVVDQDGKVNLGAFQGRIPVWNLAEARGVLPPALNRQLTSPLSSWNLVIMDWEVVAGVFVSNRGYYCSAQVFCHDLETGRQVDHRVALPFTLGMDQNEKVTRFASPGLRIYLEKQPISSPDSLPDSPTLENKLINSRRLQVMAGKGPDRIIMDGNILSPPVPFHPLSIVEQPVNRLLNPLLPVRVVQYEPGLTTCCSLEVGAHRFNLTNCTTFFWREQSAPTVGKLSQQLFFMGRIPDQGVPTITDEAQMEDLWGLVRFTRRQDLYSGKGYLWHGQRPILGAASIQIPCPIQPNAATPVLGRGQAEKALALEFTPWGHRSAICHPIKSARVFKHRKKHLYGTVGGRVLTRGDDPVQVPIIKGEGFLNLI